jgi:pyruvate dehydrogenase E1 component alpha subunit
LIGEGILTEEDAKQLQNAALKEIEEAVKFAENSPEPSIDSLLEDVYA